MSYVDRASRRRGEYSYGNAVVSAIVVHVGGRGWAWRARSLIANCRWVSGSRRGGSRSLQRGGRILKGCLSLVEAQKNGHQDVEACGHVRTCLQPGCRDSSECERKVVEHLDCHRDTHIYVQFYTTVSFMFLRWSLFVLCSCFPKVA